MDLSVIIVSWNVQAKLKENLTSLFQSEGDFKFEVFVVDNASEDESVLMVERDFPRVHLIKNQENLGFSKANNQAIALAQGHFVLLLNPDMKVQKNTLFNILNWSRKNIQATVTSCQLVDKNKKTIKHVRRFPKLFDQLMIVLKLPHLWPSLLNSYLLPNFNYSVASKVDSVRGAFFMINRDSYQNISGQKFPFLDERYFVWFEEVDFCRQVYNLGGEVWYTPVAVCQDYVGQSFKQLNRRSAQSYFRQSMLQYFQKWEKPWKKRILSCAWRLVSLFI